MIHTYLLSHMLSHMNYCGNPPRKDGYMLPVVVLSRGRSCLSSQIMNRAMSRFLDHFSFSFFRKPLIIRSREKSTQGGISQRYIVKLSLASGPALRAAQRKISRRIVALLG